MSSLSWLKKLDSKNVAVDTNKFEFLLVRQIGNRRNIFLLLFVFFYFVIIFHSEIRPLSYQ